MKKKISIIILGIILLTGFIPRIGQVSAQAQTSVSFQVFYDQLSPYGTWVSYPDYGYVWVPAGGSNFRPYGTRGHWVYADEGWTWVSDYSWGWAPFHYGNWFYDDSYGWMWAPGYEWAPAWVTWGEYGGNYCWAPIGPRVDIGVSFGSYRPPVNYWTFCPRERITSVNVSNYYVRNIHTTTVINNITVINNVNRGGGGRAYLRGPAPTNVARYTHTTVRPVAIQASARPGAANVQHGRLAIYRPNVQNNSASARPSQVRDLHALRPVARTNATTAGTAPGNNNPPAHAPASRPSGAPVARGGNPSQQHTAPQQRPTPQQQRPLPQQQPRQAPQQQPIPQQHPAPAQQHLQPQQQHPAPQQRPAPQQQRPLPQQQPRPMPQQQHQPPQQRPAPQQQHPTPQQRPMPQRPNNPAPRPAQPVNRPAPHPAPKPAPPPAHPNNPGGPEHHG
ncbi:MAG TPA: DUF6600 domain-containing protein [Puia sp.]|nr:DUF6600 domain-containing protein [Puia sp.]